MRSFVTLILIAGAAACTTESSSSGTDPRQLMPKADHPSFVLYVSNQSLDNTVVDIHVAIDGTPAVQGDFDVFTGHGSGEGCGGPVIPQHNWYEFGFDLAPGPHEITVASDDVGATLAQTVTIDATQYGVLDYWFDAANTPEKFDFSASTEQPAFE